MLILVGHGLAEAQVVVNELMASNSLAVSDPDFDDSSEQTISMMLPNGPFPRGLSFPMGDF